MRPFLAIVKRELRAVTKERTIMIAVMIQLFIASFSSVIVIGLISYYDPESIGLHARANVRVGLIGDTGSPLARFLRDHQLRVVAFSSIPDAEAAFQEGQIDTILFVPEDSGGVVETRLFLPESEARATVVLMVLTAPLREYENHLRERRGVHVRYASMQGTPPTTYEFLYASLIPLLMFFPAFVAGSMVVDSISEEFEGHTLDTLRCAPVSSGAVFGAKVVAAVILAVLQSTLWTLLLHLNRIHLHRLGLVLLLSEVVAGMNAVAAALVATYFKDRERSQFVYSLLVLISVSSGYLLGASPVTLMTRLSTGDYYTGVGDVAVYVAVLLVLAALFIPTSRKLMTATG